MIGMSGRVIGFADGKGGMHPEPGLPVVSKESGLILGFTDGKGRIGGADTVRRMYRGRELGDEVDQRIRDYMDSNPGLSGSARDGGITGGGGAEGEEAEKDAERRRILERAASTPYASRPPRRDLGARTAEVEHTLTREWLRSNSSSSGIRRAAMEGLLRSLGVSAYFEVSSTGDRVNPKGAGIGVDYVTTDDGGIDLTFKWRA